MTAIALDLNKALKEHNRYMYLLAHKIVKNEADAEDVVQDASIKAFKSFEKFKGGSEIKTWLHRVTVNTAMNFLRDKKSETSLPDNSDEESGYLLTGDPADIFEAELFAKLFIEKLDTLPDNMKETFLAWSEGLTYKELSEKFSVPEGTAKSRVSKARSLLTD